MTETENREPDRNLRQADHRYDDNPHYNMRELDRRMQIWEVANGIICVLFLWAPMAAAAFHR